MIVIMRCAHTSKVDLLLDQFDGTLPDFVRASISSRFKESSGKEAGAKH
jgi:hypothetical protein